MKAIKVLTLNSGIVEILLYKNIIPQPIQSMYRKQQVIDVIIRKPSVALFRMKAFLKNITDESVICNILNITPYQMNGTWGREQTPEFLNRFGLTNNNSRITVADKVKVTKGIYATITAYADGGMGTYYHTFKVVYTHARYTASRNVWLVTKLLN